MSFKNILIYILYMAVITYIIRVIPFVLFRKEIKNRFIRSFIYYVPYTVLAAMIFPAAIYATGSVVSGIVGIAVAVIVAFFKDNMTIVALSSTVSVFLTERILFLLNKLPY